MKQFFFVLALSTIGSVSWAQNVALVNNVPVHADEFLWVYTKNHTDNTIYTLKDLKAYLNLYINFKLKVADARSMGLDLDSGYISEIDGYKTTLMQQKDRNDNAKELNFILNEYKEGVLMFNVSEKKIWNQTDDNEEILKDYYTRNKTKYAGLNYNEIKGNLIGDYQQDLENQWIKDLKKKYKVIIYERELKKLAKP
ncbi:hypothetical protein [Pedobacter montanisoli]|uniref:Uncharacterized protein n=1 Tax=Pedobacter montanisoli TaxID=2923277 RepID=A0ABS9ZUA3_9SPHI|nr:hypothetical protein [Pedobacter montanisoli]MCJ0742098.1 hypothetical protein [Pedobacter montanisoli]